MNPIVIPRRAIPFLSLPFRSLPVAVRPAPSWAYAGEDFFEKRWIRPAGIPTQEAFGVPAVSAGVLVAGIHSGEAVGTPRAVMAAEIRLGPSGSVTGENIGTPAVIVPRNIRREESEIMAMLLAA